MLSGLKGTFLKQIIKENLELTSEFWVFLLFSKV